MKKIIFMTSIVAILLPVNLRAEEEKKDFGEELYNPVRAFFEIGANIFNNVEETFTIDSDELTDTEAFSINNSGHIALGMDIYGVQIGLSPSISEYEDMGTQTIMQIKLDVPFGTNVIQPFISLGVSMNWLELEIDADTVEDSSVGYLVGGGLKVNIDRNIYAKIGFNYNYVEFEKNYYGYNAEIDLSNVQIFAALGCVF